MVRIQTAPLGSPLSECELELANEITTVMKAAMPRTRQITRKTSTCGLERKYLTRPFISSNSLVSRWRKRECVRAGRIPSA